MEEDMCNVVVVQNEGLNLENNIRINSIVVQTSIDEEDVIHEQLDLEPFVGQTFLSEEEAYVFYQNYAILCGFSIRKDWTQKSKKDGVINIDPNKELRNRVSTKCICNAHLHIKLRRSNEIFPEEWHVNTLTQEHNHALLSQSQVRFLPANRMISPEDEKCILLLKEAGLAVRQIIRVLDIEKMSSMEIFLRKTVYGDDVSNLLEYFKSCKEENSNFHYVVKVDHERDLEHLRWCPTQSIEWYDKYGDVVVFDTTYKVNVYDMPCAISVGINNHGKTISYGCALLRNETIDTFKWLMKTRH
ncbi:Protein FAR1-RELATED SEQUENCE 11 [Bienertia sinuspersici]